ncbi:hypothetical protein RHGRI_000336 [Rhododendron griersonianum]|uniref:Uncharacterized protein n=1 Tax=Rhododendron griersonianum TaxID=479676 RepID=A0AAV6LJG6_9ERIC|nr:hypothetical protein RHGRI_000336 [Rhododendron griersonianum]
MCGIQILSLALEGIGASRLLLMMLPQKVCLSLQVKCRSLPIPLVLLIKRSTWRLMVNCIQSG